MELISELWRGSRYQLTLCEIGFDSAFQNGRFGAGGALTGFGWGKGDSSRSANDPIAVVGERVNVWQLLTSKSEVGNGRNFGATCGLRLFSKR